MSVFAQEKLKISFVNPDSKGDIFWDLFSSVMQASADDLDIDLSIYYSVEKNRFEYLELVKAALRADPKPDYLVTIFQRNTAEELIEMSAAANVPLFTVNTGIYLDEAIRIGKPRERYPNWIGQMLPDDVHAGYLLATTLIDQIRSLDGDSDQTIELMAISGNRDSTAGHDRNLGLRKALVEFPNVKMNQLVFTDWSFETAKTKASTLLERYPNTRLVWAASDLIALGVHEAIKENASIANDSVELGGIDWSKQGLDAVSDKTLAASVGGHFIEGAFALVLLHDHHKGLDFADDLGTQIQTKFTAITHATDHNVSNYIKEHKWAHIDFKKLSKVHNAELQKYNLCFEALLK